jgi:hypothetical protein
VDLEGARQLNLAIASAAAADTAAAASFNAMVTAEFFFQSLRRSAVIVSGFQLHASTDDDI